MSCFDVSMSFNMRYNKSKAILNKIISKKDYEYGPIHVIYPGDKWKIIQPAEFRKPKSNDSANMLGLLQISRAGHYLRSR